MGRDQWLSGKSSSGSSWKAQTLRQAYPGKDFRPGDGTCSGSPPSHGGSAPVRNPLSPGYRFPPKSWKEPGKCR